MASVSFPADRWRVGSCTFSTRLPSGKLPVAPIALARSEVDQLCPRCGLCCDSVLFADVELRKGDDTQRLQQLGLTLKKKGASKQAFSQPCACFDGKLCGIYAGRPKRCRTFECGLLKRVKAGTLEVKAALKKIDSAKRLADQVRELLRAHGQPDETLALTHRYAAAMSAPVNLADEAGAERHGELMLAVSGLMQQLQKDFLRE